MKKAILVFCVAAGLMMQGCTINFPLFRGERGPLKRHVIKQADRFWNFDEILIIDLTGIVSIEGAEGWFGVGGPGMLVELKDRLEEAKKNPFIRAVILRVDSAGGGVTASDLIYHEILEFKKARAEQKESVVVIAMMQDIAASGGLYIAMAADEIYAMPTTITGSIGVITLLPKIERLGEKIGLEMRVIKSGENKDMGSLWRDLSPAEQELFQKMISEMYERFVSVILESRADQGLTRDKLLEIADGRVFSGKVAAENGLIDGVAYPDEVIERAKELSGIRDAAIISYEYPYMYRGNIYASSKVPKPTFGGQTEINIMSMDLGLGDLLPRDARFLYMWLP